MVNKFKNKFKKAGTRLINPLWSIYQNGKIRLFWLRVLLTSYWNPERAGRTAINWHEKYREKFLEYYDDDLITHVAGDPRDNITLQLSWIERDKKDCLHSVRWLRMVAREYIKGHGLILSTIEWRRQWI